MRSPFTRLAVGLLTFLVGVGLASAWVARRAGPRTETVVTTNERINAEVTEAVPAVPDVRPVESPEERAVRLAEEFVARNGYTDLPPERDKLSYESIEWETNVDDLLKRRHNTLERKAYGVRYGGRLGAEGGWTIIFRYRTIHVLFDEEWYPTGRAVTMDGQFRNLRVEHKSFYLHKADKYL